MYVVIIITKISSDSMGGSLRQVAASTLVQAVPAHARAADGSDPTCTISRRPRRFSTSAMVCSHILVFLPFVVVLFFGPQVLWGDACARTRHGASGACTIYRRREPECCTDNFADPARGNHNEPRSRTTGICKIDCLPKIPVAPVPRFTHARGDRACMRFCSSDPGLVAPVR